MEPYNLKDGLDFCHEIFNDRPGKQYGNKLRTYRLFKNNFAFESYFDLDNFNRNILIRFRII
jgi:hypothetical protein